MFVASHLSPAQIHESQGQQRTERAMNPMGRSAWSWGLCLPASVERTPKGVPPICAALGGTLPRPHPGEHPIRARSPWGTLLHRTHCALCRIWAWFILPDRKKKDFPLLCFRRRVYPYDSYPPAASHYWMTTGSFRPCCHPTQHRGAFFIPHIPACPFPSHCWGFQQTIHFEGKKIHPTVRFKVRLSVKITYWEAKELIRAACLSKHRGDLISNTAKSPK